MVACFEASITSAKEENGREGVGVGAGRLTALALKIEFSVTDVRVVCELARPLVIRGR